MLIRHTHTHTGESQVGFTSAPRSSLYTVCLCFSAHQLLFSLEVSSFFSFHFPHAHSPSSSHLLFLSAVQLFPVPVLSARLSLLYLFFSSLSLSSPSTIKSLVPSFLSVLSPFVKTLQSKLAQSSDMNYELRGRRC